MYREPVVKKIQVHNERENTKVTRKRNRETVEKDNQEVILCADQTKFIHKVDYKPVELEHLGASENIPAQGILIEDQPRGVLEREDLQHTFELIHSERVLNLLFQALDDKDSVVLEIHPIEVIGKV